ncbi:hypothetical protein CMV_010249 [Castanea mollissima]|uniref:Uncharacterized protein n=1 Tax=Castanea mollissima TaxID=60419 RepID=A0A8J4RJD8_9ROSI|nr:hypothetical protein CMV_010249 [Castanea mollissima]
MYIKIHIVYIVHFDFVRRKHIHHNPFGLSLSDLVDMEGFSLTKIIIDAIVGCFTDWMRSFLGKIIFGGNAKVVCLLCLYYFWKFN